MSSSTHAGLWAGRHTGAPTRAVARTDRVAAAATGTQPDRQPDTYTAVASRSAAAVISGYSTSFGVASRLLAEPVRTHVRNIYALVRIADEIVDSPSPDLPAERRAELLTELEADTERALQEGRSNNLVVHAFARTAREVGIEREIVDAFFAAMRTDLGRRRHDDASLEQYVYGSAEVVGLMCLRAFLAREPDPRAAYDRLAPGARRLGAAFQKVNFLRDIAEDERLRGRRYLPGVHLDTFTDAQRDAALDDIEADLAAAVPAMAQLPPGSRRAVVVAHALFAALTRQLRATPAERIARERVRVPGRVKAAVVLRALAGGARW
jgi:phytoene/squalene synthetase